MAFILLMKVSAVSYCGLVNTWIRPKRVYVGIPYPIEKWKPLTCQVRTVEIGYRNNAKQSAEGIADADG